MTQFLYTVNMKGSVSVISFTMTPAVVMLKQANKTRINPAKGILLIRLKNLELELSELSSCNSPPGFDTEEETVDCSSSSMVSDGSLAL